MAFHNWGRYPVKGSECIRFLLLLAIVTNIARVVFPAEVVGLALLSNGVVFPLVGVGVGNMDHGDIFTIISQIPEYPDHLPVLIDTAQASDNDSFIIEGILAREARLGRDHREQPRAYHIISKVWYTHLGYNRTRYAVQRMQTSYQPLLQNNSIQVFLTVLLHWPRCYEDIEWMDCQGEELALPEEIRSLGPNPNENPIHAYQESWRALEDLYLEKAIANIGLSNFLFHDLQQLYSGNFDLRIEPTLNQINVWNLFFDEETIQFLSKHSNILFQVYGLMSILDQKDNAPAAYEYLLFVAEKYGLQVHQIISVWFLQMKISIVPRTQNEEHLLQNSLPTLLQVPHLNTKELDDIEEAIRSLLQGEDSDRFWAPEEELDEDIELDVQDDTEEEQEEDNEYDEEVGSEEEEEEENLEEDHDSFEGELQEF